MIRVAMLALLVVAGLGAAEPGTADAGTAEREHLRRIDAPWYDAERDGWRRIEIPTPKRDTARKDSTDISAADGNAGGFIQVIAWTILILVAALLAWIAVQSLRGMGSGVGDPVRIDPAKPRPADLSTLPFTVPESADPAAALAAALAAQDWSLAVVWVYAGLLIRLDAAGMVRLGRGATNRGCLRQAHEAVGAGRPARAAAVLGDAVQVFERTYFGHRAATRAEAERLAAALTEVVRLLDAEAGR